MTDSSNSVEVRRNVDDPLTYGIIGAAQKVHRTLGPGFKESTYHKALSKELMTKEIAFASQPQYQVFYEGMLCGVYQPDLVVLDTVLLELKAVSAIAPEHKAHSNQLPQSQWAASSTTDKLWSKITRVPPIPELKQK